MRFFFTDDDFMIRTNFQYSDDSEDPSHFVHEMNIFRNYNGLIDQVVLGSIHNIP